MILGGVVPEMMIRTTRTVELEPDALEHGRDLPRERREPVGGHLEVDEETSSAAAWRIIRSPSATPPRPEARLFASSALGDAMSPWYLRDHQAHAEPET